ncbi:MAG: transporter [Pseudomonadales bacterium]
MKNNNPWIACACVLALTAPTVYADDLSELIPSLYGGDGITLQGNENPDRNHEAHFTAEIDSSINLLNDQLGREVRTLPIGTSSPAGIAYKYDAEKGTYDLISRDLGPVLARGSRTLGKGNWSFAATVTAFEYDEFDSNDVGELVADSQHDFDVIPPPNSAESFENDIVRVMFDVDIEVQSLSLFGSYGITDRLDINVIVPIVAIDLNVDAMASVVESPLNDLAQRGITVHQFDEDGEAPNDSVSGDETGLGDIAIGLTYQLAAEQNYSVASAFIVKSPSGDEDNFLGTGSTTVQPALFAELDLGSIFGIHGNIGYEWDSDESDESAVRGIVGITAGNSVVTASLEFAGRFKSGDDAIGQDKSDAAFGVKWNPGKNFILSGNVIVPINDDGLRSDLITSVGLELLL